MKRPAQDDFDAGPAPWRGKGGSAVSFRGMKVFKALCPDRLVSEIIGIGGATKESMEKESGARLRISGRSDFYPGTKCRILTASAPNFSQILSVLEHIVQKVADVVSADHEKGSGKGMDESEKLEGKEPGEYLMRAALPKESTGALIGPRGARIKALREQTGAKVFVENDAHEGHQMVRLIGPFDSLLRALPELCQCIEAEMSDERLAEWASVTNFTSPGKGALSRKGTGKGGKESWKAGQDRHTPAGAGFQEPLGEALREEVLYDEDSAEGGVSASASVEVINKLVDQFVPGALDMAHAISCDLPNDRVGGMIGRRGEFISHVQRETGAKVVFSDAPASGQGAHRTMTVTGPLVAVYSAHMMMMRRYHENEANARGGSGNSGATPQETIEEMQSRIAELQRQLQEARSGGGASTSGSKGTGKLGGSHKGKGKGKK